MQGVAEGDKEAATGIAIAQRLVAAVRPLCAGVHMMALGWEAQVPDILRGSGVRRPLS